MIENNSGRDINDRYDNDNDNINASLGNTEGQQQKFSSANRDDLNDEEDNPLTRSTDDDNEEGRKQDATKIADKNRNIATSYHDNRRVTSRRANEANDRLDTGSGGLSAGGVKSATDL
jgi:hypothetical protein